MRRRALIALTAALVAAAAAPAARAGSDPMVAVGPDGTARAGWLEGGPTVTGRSWTDAGTLFLAQYVSPLRTQVLDSAMAADASGARYYVWRRPTPEGTATVEGRRQAPDGSLGPVLKLSSATSDALSATVAVDPAGNAVFVWWRNYGAEQIIQARRLSASGTLGPSLMLSAAGERSRRPAVAMAPDGNALVVWDGYVSGAYRVKSRRIKPDGTLGVIQNVTEPLANLESAQVAMDGAGNALITWNPSSQTVHASVQARRRTAAGFFGAVETVAAPAAGADAHGVRVAMNPAGKAMIAWYRYVGDHQEIQARYRNPGGGYGSVLTLSRADDAFDCWRPRVALDSDGNALVVWELIGSGDSASVIQARRRSSTTAVGAIENVSGTTADGPEARNPALGMAPGGTATILWEDVGPEPDRILGRRRASGGAYGPIRWLDEP